MEQKRSFKGVWIPRDIWLAEDLSMQEKVLLVEIDSLDNEDGCYATNEYFGRFMGLSAKHISRLVSSLTKKKKLNIKQENIRGKTKRTLKTAYAKMRTLPPQKCGGTIRKNAEPSVNNIVNKPSNKIPEQSSGDAKEIVAIIDLFAPVNPSYKRWYAQKVQRDAVRNLLAVHGMERLKGVIGWLPTANRTKYVPTITTPQQLETKWASLEAAAYKLKNEKPKGPKLIKI